jgi:hypothetical protein
MAERPARERKPKAPPPPKPWQRAEAGRYRSSDGRFTLESGGGAWFVTDDQTLDELGLARTTGPFATLEAAKAAADGARGLPAEASPLAARIAEAAARPKAESVARPKSGPKRPAAEAGVRVTVEAGVRPTVVPPRDPASEPEAALALGPEPASRATPEPEPPPRTWLDDLMDADRNGAIRASKLIAALERDGVTDAEAIVRRDLLGGAPAVATRLLARAVLAALASLRDPSAAQVAEAVAAAIASSPKRAGLPGWELTERDGPTAERRSLRLTADDLRAAAEHEAVE